MRKIPLLLATVSLTICTQFVKAQYYPAPMGIGFSQENINGTVEIKDGNFPVLRLTGPGGAGKQCAIDLSTFDPGVNLPAFRMLATDIGGYQARLDFQFKTGGGIGAGVANRMSLDPNGFLGIGTSNPATKLHVSGGNIAASISDQLLGFVQLWNDNAIVWRSGNQNNGLRFGSATDLNAANWSEKMRIMDNGAVVIGVFPTIAADYKLFVEDGIRTRKVKVDVATWADYVFHANYRLRPLSEVELYIKENGHLPEVPSEEEVTKTGIDLGNNQVTLLKKIEELTLYMIEQNKKQENQEKLIQEQSKLLQAQQQRLEVLEKQLKEKL